MHGFCITQNQSHSRSSFTSFHLWARQRRTHETITGKRQWLFVTCDAIQFSSLFYGFSVMKQPLIGVWMDQSHTNENKEFVQNLFIHLNQSCAFYARHIAADCARLFKTALLCFAIGIQKSKHLNNSAWSKSNSIQRRCIESQRKKNAKNNNKKNSKKSRSCVLVSSVSSAPSTTKAKMKTKIHVYLPFTVNFFPSSSSFSLLQLSIFLIVYRRNTLKMCFFRRLFLLFVVVFRTRLDLTNWAARNRVLVSLTVNSVSNG